ncbi:phosphotransferase family protein [Amycolatopsis sp. YIM 10]|uniref:phosphotransferase family protein n=1 Tax=Amycolatopsis sp. YIM 10 TaxID=2653857 RepID=UPI0012908075|nr:phosphotransferase family protein [Amycolatopsis sp. YIM 10]QFU89551.1 Phosphotransferase enzyme family protein [Amycolatopsis sp. YIM 10]
MSGHATVGSGQREVGRDELPVAALEEYLAKVLGRPFRVDAATRLTAGASNTMYVLRDTGGEEIILRAPPRVKTSKSAHDVGREYRVLRALEGTGVPHPAANDLCTDTGLLGVPFMVLQRVRGFHLELPLDPPYPLDPAALRTLVMSYVDTLAAIGEVDWRSAGLEGFGRPDGFLSRQVDRWLSQLEGYRNRPLPHLERVTSWLRANQPPDQAPGLLHGDYQFLNVLFAPEPGGGVAAVVDWEQATIGDPLVDLGWVLGLWAEAGERSAVSGDAPWITQEPGMPSRVEILDRYACTSSRDLDAVGYYQVLALFKLACILEGSYAKALRSESDIARHLEFGEMVPRLLADAAAIVRGERR